ncbi:hypothetical protein NDU88_007091 [Pleurodeles waltl]|uniref:Uncharacterized protein n=1 Tax=Pleurodeles waltl TaxID=8319 RepID=A0AAV7RT24_PLEWA|nr:hypothetical protein NDU88_007091 [Pleurodeles waltl]
MTYDAEGVIKRKREDGRQERSEEKEEPRTRKSRGEETTTIQEPEEERENTGAGEQSTKREPTFTQELKGEEDTASNVIETEGETRKAGRLEDRRNQWATPNPTEEKSGDHLLAGRAPGGTWPSQPKTLLVMAAELWEEDENGEKPLLEYTSELKSRLQTIWEDVRGHMEKAQEKQKRYYDRNTQVRSFVEGDEY